MVLFIAVSLSGCYGGEQVGERAFVRELAVSKSGNGYELEALIYDGTEEVKVSGTGETIVKALENCGENAGRSMYLGHTERVIMGEYDEEVLRELACEGMKLSVKVDGDDSCP